MLRGRLRRCRARERRSPLCWSAAAVCSGQTLGLRTVQPSAEISCPVVFSFPRGKEKRSAGKLKDPFFVFSPSWGAN